MRKAFLVGFCFLAFIVLGLYLGFVHAREPVLAVYPVESVFDCRVLDSSNTRYILRNDVYSNGICFRISGENIVLDGNGFEVKSGDGSGGIDDLVGVFAQDSINLSVKNLQISDFNQGVVFDNVIDSTLINLSSKSNAYSGITLRDSSGNLIMKSFVEENGEYGILVKSGKNNILEENIAKYNTLGLWNGVGIGISLENSFDNSLINNSAEFNNKGILLYQSDSNEIKKNILSFNSKGSFDNGQGLYIDHSNDNNLEENSIENNEGDGIYVISGQENKFFGNIVRGQYGNGIIIQDGNYNMFDSDILDNNQNGLFISSGENNNFTNEEISGSYYNGIYIEGNSPENLFDSVAVEGTYNNYDINFATFNAKHTSIVNNLFGRYYAGGNYMGFSNEEGVVEFLRPIFGEGADLKREVSINHNEILIDSTQNPGLDKPAQITFYNMDGGFENPRIYRNDYFCTLSICQNLTSLNDPIVVIRVSKSGDYSIRNI